MLPGKWVMDLNARIAGMMYVHEMLLTELRWALRDARKRLTGTPASMLRSRGQRPASCCAVPSSSELSCGHGAVLGVGEHLCSSSQSNGASSPYPFE